jgi:hypothetical protein
MPDYEASSFDPPAPIANVTLRNPTNGTSVSNVRLLLDSGADVTLLPQAAVSQLSLTESSAAQYELIGFDGSKSHAAAVTLDMLLLRRAFRGQYLVIDNECGILGRDVLNCVAILLDGPRRQWSEQPPS